MGRGKKKPTKEWVYSIPLPTVNIPPQRKTKKKANQIALKLDPASKIEGDFDLIACD